MASTVPEEYLVVFLRVIRGSSNDSWNPCMHRVLRILDTVLGWWISKNGIEMAGPIMQKVRSPPLRGSTWTSQYNFFRFIYLQGYGFRPSQTLYPFSHSLALQT